MGATSIGEKSFARYLWYPVTAIIAALSVQYSKAGIKVFQPKAFPVSVSAFLRPLFALTPPAIQTSFIPVCSTAFFSLFIRILIILSCTDAQILFRF